MGLLEEWCQFDTARLLGCRGLTPAMLRQKPEALAQLAGEHGLAVVEVETLPEGAALDLASAQIRVDQSLHGLGRALVLAREYAHARIHRAEQGIAPMGRRHTWEAVVYAATLLGFARTEVGWRRPDS